MAGTETNEQEQSGHRPGLRERRLSRVHFEGDTDEGNSNAYTGGAQLHQDGSVQALTLSRAKRTSVQSDGSSGGRQDYFETRDRQMAGAATYGSQGEEARGRPIRPFEHHDEAGPQHSRNLGPPGRTPFEMPMPTEDLSPKSTTFGAETPMAVEREVQYPTTNMSTGHRLLPDNMPQDPRSGPFAAHVKGNYPFHNQSTLPGMAAPRLPFSNIDTDQHQRRFSAPTDRRQDQRLGTSASPRNSLNTYRNGQEALSDPYTVLPPARISKSQTNRGANYNPQYGRGSMDLYERAQASPTPAYSFYEPPTALPAPPYHTQPVMSLKPALKRTQTEEETRRTTRDAVDIVHHHTQGLRRRNVPGTQTLESMPRNAGVLSNLLQLYGDNAPAGPRRTSSSDSKWDGEGTQMSRATSVDSHFAATRAKFGRTDSAASFATTLCEGDLDPDDPRAVRMAAAEKAKDTPGLPMSRNDEFGFNDANSISSKKSLKNMLRRTKSFMVDEDAVYGDLMGRKASAPQVGDDKKRRLSITRHVADILARHKFLLKLARALMTYGSPSHRMEQQLNATAQVLEVDAQFVHLPSVVIASFGDSDTHTSETHFVKTSGGLDLGKLHHVHTIYRQVVHDEAGVAEGSAALSRLLKAPPIYKVWQRMIFAAICAGTIAPIGFGGSFVDAVSAKRSFSNSAQRLRYSKSSGSPLPLEQHCLSYRITLLVDLRRIPTSLSESSPPTLRSDLLRRFPACRISVATVTSFIARGLSRTDYFCYPALATSGVVLILPGYAIRKHSVVVALQYAHTCRCCQSAARSNSLLRTLSLAQSEWYMRSFTPCF